MRSYVYLLLLKLLLCNSVFAQESAIPEHFWQENGLPYIRNFSPKEYGEYPQNWCIAQDKRGLMYFANNHGILIYDGVSWRLVKTQNQSIVRSLCIQDGRIYFGGRQELGYLEADATGELRPTSLLDKIPEKHRNFTDVWFTASTDNAVIFRTSNYIFRWADGKMHVLPANQRFHHSAIIDGTLQIYDNGTGLMQLKGDSLQLVPGGDRIAVPGAGRSAREWVWTILPYDETRILVGTRSQGLFLSNETGFSRFPTQADDFLLENGLYCGSRLQQNLFALATEKGGVIIIDKMGNLCQVLNKDSGLRDEQVNDTFVDREGALWLALDNGLARVETPAPLSRFSASSGLESMVVSVIRHQGTLYAGTQTGVYSLHNRASGVISYPEFQPVTESLKFCWSFLSVGQRLLVGTQQGVAEIADGRAMLINEDNPQRSSATHLHRSERDSSVVYVAQPNGLAALQLENGRRKSLGKFPGITESVYRIAEGNQGVLWLGTTQQGVVMVEPGPDPTVVDSTKLRVTKFGEANGLTKNLILPYQVADRIVFATQKGLRHFDSENQWFPPDSTFGQPFADSSCWIYQLNEDADGNVWIIAGMGKKPLNGVAVRQPNGTYLWHDAPFLRLNDIEIMNCIYPEPDSLVWFGGSEGLARYNTYTSKNYAIKYPATIRRVAGIKSDSLFFGGNHTPAFLNPELDYEMNSLRFEFSSPSYDDVSANRFQVRLSGFEKTWSNWSAETRKDYTGLREGDYLFEVRSKNIYNNQSEEATFAFTILSPWYRSWWAYLVYALMLTGSVALVVKGRVRQLQRRTRELEALVHARTVTIREQAEKLQEVDKMKSRFFANISHEFRTPLTLILGPVEDAIQKIKDAAVKNSLQTVQRNASRLQRLINQLLDLSQLEAGRMTLQVQEANLAAFMKRAVMLFASAADKRNISLNFAAEPSLEKGRHYFDHDIIEKVIYNLLSNAIKYTPSGGEISVTVSGAETATIRVKDTGVGIAAENLRNIFERFYQSETSESDFQEGTGIGLALTRELVELHRGEITVTSEVSKGTEFTVRLPVARSFFRDNEIREKKPDSYSRLKTVADELLLPAEPARTETAPPEDATIILIVEDHAEVRQYIREHLEGDYHILEAQNGKKGLAVATESVPDLVISDVMMPEMDGTEFCKQLKTNEKISHIPVILLTAKAGDEDKVEGLETGADDYLVKPFNVTELKVRVQNLIGQHRKLRERFRREGLLTPRDEKLPSVEEAFLQRLMTLVEEHLSEEDFGVEELSAQLHLGRRQLLRKLQALTGQTPTDFLRTVRLRRAKQILEQKGGNSISEIAFEVGFNNLSYFAKTFKDEFGVLPSDLVGKDG
jgi:signal transduction histidine kinase/DNA-binding response OmpR family regulator